jgi:hypothetical protein
MLPTTDPSTLLLAALYLAMIFLLGYAVVCAATQRPVRHWLQLLGLSFAAGAGVLPLLLFVVSIAGVKPSRGRLAGIAILTIIAMLLLRHKGRLVKPSIPSPRGRISPMTLLGLLSLALIMTAAANIAAEASWPGLTDIDAFAIWGFKAKWVLYDALRPMPPVFLDPTLSYSHQDYPLSLPLLIAGLYALLGHVDENAAKLLLLPIWCALTAIMYGAIRRFSRRAIALAVTAVFCTAPVVVGNAGLIVAETSLLLAFTGASTQLLQWMEQGERGELILAALFAAIAAFTKNEGLAMLPVFGLGALGSVSRIKSISKPGSEVLRRAGSDAGSSSSAAPQIQRELTRMDRRLADWLTATAFGAVMIAPWLIYRIYLPHTHEDYGTKLLRPSILLANLPVRFWSVLTQFLSWFAQTPYAGLIWGLLVLSGVLGSRALVRRPVLILWGILLIQLSLYLATFIVTPWDVGELLPMITPKLQAQASPIAALLIALHLQRSGRSQQANSARASPATV